MKIIVATNNAHKLDEIKQILPTFKLFSWSEILKPFEIEEHGRSFKENALIKSEAVFNALSQKEQEKFITLSDDSGICVKALGGKPGIYSARFSEIGTDEANRKKLIESLKTLGLEKSEAYFCASVALSSKWGNFAVHGYLHGEVICEERGQNGFGYDSLFIPKGFNQTLAELTPKEKNAISHRFKALELAKILLNNLQRNYQ